MKASPSIILRQRRGLPGEESPHGDLQDMVTKVMAILRHRRRLFLFPLLTGILAALIVSLFLPRQYMLGTVFERREDPILAKLVANTPFNVAPVKASMRFALTGYQAVDQAVADADLLADLPRDADGRLTEEGRRARQELVSSLVPCLYASLLDSGNKQEVFQLRYIGERPELGRQVVTQLKDNYIASMQSQMTDLQNQAESFFSQEAEKRQSEVNRIRTELAQMLARQPEIDPARPDYLNQKIAAEQSAIDQLLRSRREHESDLALRKEYLAQLTTDEPASTAGTPASRPAMSRTRLVDNPVRARLRGEIAGVQSKIADAKTVKGMKEAHPHVMALRDKLQQLWVEFESLPEQVESGLISSLPEPPLQIQENEIARLNLEIRTLATKLQQIDDDVATHQETIAGWEQKRATQFEGREIYLARQQEMEKIARDLQVWNRNLEEINRLKTAEAGDRGVKFVTVEEARLPSLPFAPKLSNSYLMSIGIGLVLAVSLVFLRETFDRSFRSPARVRQVLGIPVLEAIEDIPAPSKRTWLRPGRLFQGLAVMQVLAILVAGSMVYLRLQQPRLYEQISSQAQIQISMVHDWSGFRVLK